MFPLYDLMTTGLFFEEQSMYCLLLVVSTRLRYLLLNEGLSGGRRWGHLEADSWGRTGVDE